ncbi:MFS general substrate transporter [Thozetella sp. PMI_491]|nr:MFS general substrate transporter [Thozetella sp. PMI_491]
MPSSLAEPPSRGNPAQESTSTLSGSTRHDPSPDGIGGKLGKGPGPDGLDEQSPLLSPTSTSDDELEGFIEHPADVDEQPDEFQTTKSVWYLILLTLSIGGLQIAWSVELSNGSPYLLSLGLSKSLMALVWIAGPLSGTLVQPYIGMLSDNCRIRWGKRKPFMVGGAAATMVSLMVLAWTKEIVAGFLGLFGADSKSDGVKVTTIVVAVIWVYILDFAINTVQAAIRAFIVDCAPPHQQEAANAWASRLTGIGNIVGYVAGYLNLPKLIGFLGDTQFKELCAIASVALGGTILLSVLLIRERNPQLEGPPPKDQAGLLAFFIKIFTSIKRLPPQTKKVCMVQFCAWVGFFPMLFYTSEYIGEIYVEPFLAENPHMTPEELDKLYEDATRVGTFALLIFAITSLATNVFLPFFIAPSFDTGEGLGSGNEVAGNVREYEDEKKSWLSYLVIPGFTLRRAWMYSQILFTGSMFCTVFVRTVEAATVLIGLVGITWALTLWAPWAIISAEISRRDAVYRARKQRASGLAGQDGPITPLDGYSSDEHGARHVLDDASEGPDQAGVILGIHNMAIASPQIIATIASSIIFKFLQKPRGEPGDHSIAVVLALGGITVFISAFFIHRIRDDPGVPADVATAVEEGRRPSTSHSRRSMEQPPRVSQERATLVRNQSFGGAEY